MSRFLVPVLVVALAVGVATMLVVNRPAPVTVPLEERVTQVVVRQMQPEDKVFMVESQGTVEPRTQTTLVAEVSGMVTAVSDRFVVGGFFREGDILLTLDDADYEVSVQQARANLSTAESQLMLEEAQAEQAVRQWESVGRDRANAPPLALRTPYVEEARARVQFAQADLARAERQLERTRIRAPYDGLVREKLVDIGQYVGAGTQLARTFAVDFAEIRLPLTDRDIAYLELPRPGIDLQNTLSTTAAPADSEQGLYASAERDIPVTLRASVGGRSYEWPAHIVRTDGVIDSSTRVYHAVAQVADPYGLRRNSNRPVLAIGSFVNATLQGITARNIFSVPNTAVRNGNQVLVMDSDQRLRQREVNILRSDAEQVYIDHGLNAGDKVIVSPVPVPIEGMRVAAEDASL
ncbi:MAG: efflux RND transporter periplasmic adaptor subunit [Pseudomonas sp.]